MVVPADDFRKRRDGVSVEMLLQAFDDGVDGSRALVNEAGVKLDEARSGLHFFDDVLSGTYPADTDDGDLAVEVLCEGADDLGASLTKRFAGKAARRERHVTSIDGFEGPVELGHGVRGDNTVEAVVFGEARDVCQIVIIKVRRDLNQPRLATFRAVPSDIGAHFSNGFDEGIEDSLFLIAPETRRVWRA